LVKPLDFSAALGAGLSLKAPSGQMIFIDCSYAFGITVIAKENVYGALGSYYGNPQQTSIQSRDIRFAFGMLFPLD